MYPMPTPFDYEASMFLAEQVVKLCRRLWTWSLATYVKLPLLRPVRYLYYVSYSFGPSLGGPATLKGDGWATLELIAPVHSRETVEGMCALIAQNDAFGGALPSIIITNWKLLHKQVYRQGEWHNTRRHPKVA